MGRGEKIKILAKDGDLCGMFHLDQIQRIGKCHVTKAMMVAIGFSIRCNGQKPGSRSVPAEILHHPVGKDLPVFQQVRECNILGKGVIVEEEGNLPAGWQATEVGH